MADEGHYYESRCVCKLCSKKFPCGKSLEAHMRSHVSSTESDEKIQSFHGFVQESDPRINYGLRENPKKTWRAEINSRIPSPPPSHSRICKQCGKGFQSTKALCGHMASHSEKDKNQKAELEYSCSDSDDAERKRMSTRLSASKNKGHKKFGCNVSSSSVSEIDGQDQEEVAMWLMLLSRDFVSGNNNNNNNNESSDNDSVILESNKSSPIEKRIGSSKKLQGKKSISEDGGISDSDSGYFLEECNSGLLSVEEFRRYSASYFGELRSGSSTKGQFQGEPRKYECYNCKKLFKSYQALGGHRPCHKRTSGAIYEPRYDSGENSLDDSTDYSRKKPSSKKNKAGTSKSHICPFCDRVFKNGQALGGHKRSHFIGENRSKASCDLLDLNLPAPEDEGF